MYSNRQYVTNYYFIHYTFICIQEGYIKSWTHDCLISGYSQLLWAQKCYFLVVNKKWFNEAAQTVLIQTKKKKKNILALY